METKRVIWKIVLGAVLILGSANSLSTSLNGSIQGNAASGMSIFAIILGVYLIYRGIYPAS